MAEQALQNSVDPEEIKKYRKSTRTQVTKSVNTLVNLLANKDGDDFDHKIIKETEVEQIETRLNENFKLFLKLHERYCHLRASGKDDTEESELDVKDAAYEEEVTSNVYPLKDQLKSYHKSLAAEEARQAKVKTIPLHQKKFKNSMIKFKVSKDFTGEQI